jgi:hypothetical protein
MLWDVEEAGRADALIEDFLASCFGPGRDAMREFYRQIDGSHPHLVLDDQLGRMFRALAEAKRTVKQASSSNAGLNKINARLNDLILYTRYAALYDRYAKAKGDERQAAFERLIRHAYRMRRTMMVHTKALYRDLAARDRTVSNPPEAGWNVPEPQNPWKSSQPFGEQELAAFLEEGIRQHPLVELDFLPVEFSETLVPAAPLDLPKVPPGSAARGRGVQTFYAWIEQAPAEIELEIAGGLIAHYRDRGNVRVDLWKLEGPGETNQHHVAHDRSVVPDGVPRVVTLAADEPGLHKITVSDGGDMTSVCWTPGTPIAYKSSLDEPINTSGRWSLYFYVPPGTGVVGLFGGSPGAILDPNGKRALTLDGRKPGYHSIPVPTGMDGKLWKVHHAAGAVRLLTVPPYLARTGDELLLPKEVVQKGSRDALDSGRAGKLGQENSPCTP